jgi:Glycosyl transferase family 2
MTRPLVSIVVNNFNYARFLPQSIESALRQTYAPTEVVVVDDASSDGSQELILGYGSRVVPVLQERNGGQGAAFNAGFAASRGDIVIFLDADDYLYPQATAQIVAAWIPGISKVQYRLDLVDGAGQRIDLFPAAEVRLDSGDVVPLLLATGRYETLVTSGNAFDRGVLRKVLPVPETDFRISADGYLVTVAPFHGPVVSVDEPLGAYRQHGSNAWGESSLATLPGRLRRSLEHDLHRYKALREAAGRMQKAVSPALGMTDYQHLGTRLASLCLDPANHSYPADSRPSLALRGALSSRHARLPWKLRLVLALWFLAAGFLPRRLASPVVAWRLAGSARTPGVDRFLKTVRRLVR